jgi:serine/threonine protein kinase
MNTEQFRRLEALYDAASALDPHERTRFINECCTDDADVRRELLAAFADGGSGLTGLVEYAAATAEGVLTAPGRRMGAYQIVRPLGQGGMGAVYLATRDDDQFRKDVAIKTLKFELNDGPAVARFRHERQILAHLEHPNIARLLDGGTTEHGTPFIVLEYVHGVQIVEWCERRELSIRQRLTLFRDVCDAVQYAHQHLIVHRDIKPTNILVTGDGVPKLLDFGIAKLLDSTALPGFDDPRVAATSALLMTPDYVSPEQVRGEAVSTATDVYSLGAVLYELLTGVRPHRLQNYDAAEIARAVCETDVTPPSALTDRRLGGDLDTIILKALEKDPARRYRSAADLSEDIRRHLEGLPLHARRDSSWYRATKFVRRHRLGVAATATGIVSLAAGAVIAARAAVRARRSDEIAQAVNNFLQNDLLAQASAHRQSGPHTRPDPDLKVRTALERAANGVGGKFERQPEIEAAIRETIGQTYLDMGLYREGRAQLQRVLELRRLTLGSEDPATLRTVFRLGQTAYYLSEYPEAESLFTQALGIQRRVLAPINADTLNTMNGLAIAYLVQGKHTLAEDLHRQTLDIRRRVLGPEHPDTLTSMHNLAIVFARQGRYEEAETLHVEALEARRRVLGPEHPFTLSSMGNLAGVYDAERKFGQAAALYEETYQIRKRLLGPEHLDTLGALNSLATIDVGQGKYDLARELFAKGLDSWNRVMGPESRDTPVWMSNIAVVLGLQGRHHDSETLFKQALDMTRRVQGSEHPATLATLADFAAMYQQADKYALADEYGAQALAGRRRVLGSDHPDTIASALDQAVTYVLEQKFDAGEALAREVGEFERKQRPDSWQRFFAESVLGASLIGLKKFEEGTPLLTNGYQGVVARRDHMLVPERYYQRRAADWVRSLAATSRYKRSEQGRESERT